MEEKEKRLARNVLLIFAAAAVIAVLLAMLKGQITGFATLQTFETENFVAGTSEEQSLSFEQIPNFVAKVGEETKFKVEPNREDVIFTDDTKMFDVDDEGVVEFTPTYEDIGRHNVWIIIKDHDGHYYYQNVAIIIEE